jgi:3-methyladenine DNA glycosylase AlkD
MTRVSPAKELREAKRRLERIRRPSGKFHPARYFRSAADLGFYNVGTEAMRALARSIYLAHRSDWTVDDAATFAGAAIRDRYLEVKSLGIDVLARHRRDFAPRLLPAWKRWLADGYAANWATTDAICCYLIGPLVVEHPELAERLRAWARHRTLWVRRASIVSLIPRVRLGESLDLAYEIARRLHGDREDLIQKAVGWTLREAGKRDMARLERYLRVNGPSIPRTTVRYAIERFPPARRRALLEATRAR